jgi:hypothetical protein
MVSEEVYSSKKITHGYEETEEDRYKEYYYHPWLWEFIKHRAIIRLLEIQGNTPLSAKRINDLVQASKKEEQSISGMRGILLQAGIIRKEKDGIIYLGGLPKWPDYQRIIPFSAQAIEHRRTHYKKNAME